MLLNSSLASLQLATMEHFSCEVATMYNIKDLDKERPVKDQVYHIVRIVHYLFYYAIFARLAS